MLEMSETDWEADGWPVKGPRTCRWLCRFIAENSLHPLAHAARFRQLAGLSAADAGTQEHERSMRILEAALTFDHLQAGELASIELIARSAQLIELRHRERIIGAVGSGPDDDAFLYLGAGKTRGVLAVCPELETWVASELAKETATLKERRKAREERKELPNNPKDKGGGARTISEPFRRLRWSSG